MSFDVAPIGPVRQTASQDPAKRRPPVAADSAAFSGDVPASPPPEVLDAIDAASRAYRELHAQGRELRFDADGDRVHVTVTDLDGNVLREIPASHALDVATGGSLG